MTDPERHNTALKARSRTDHIGYGFLRRMAGVCLAWILVLSMLAAAAPAFALTNSATGSVNGYGMDLTNASVNLNLNNNADLVIAKTVSNSTPNEGDTITYTITLTNNGPAHVFNIVVTDIVPTGVTYAAATISGGDSRNDTDPAGAGLSWTVNSLNSGANTSLTFDATVDAGTGGSVINNTATKVQTQTDTNVTGDVPSESITVNNDSDLVIAKTVSDTTPDEGDTITYTIRLTNNGPAQAENITVTDIVPVGLTYAGTITGGDGNDDSNPDTTGLTWTVNTLADGAFIDLTFNATVDAGTGNNTIGNTATKVQDQNDTDTTSDDPSEDITVNHNTQISIDDVTLAEGNSGNTNFVFTVTLDASDPDDDIVIDYTTNNGTASDASDYTANSGTLTFTAGTATLTQTVTVQVYGDTTVEANETFTVDLSLNAGNTGSATITDAQGLGTINNDDNASITIDDVAQLETDAGSTNFVFTVTLDASDPDDDIVIDYTTNNGTASDASDYTANSGTLTFTAGTATLTQTVTVQVSGDTTVEPDETFTVDLSLNAGNTGSATITDAQGLGTINNDDNATVAFANAASATADEAAGNHAITVVLNVPSGTTPGIITVDVTDATGGSATSTSDYSAVGTDTLTFPAGSANEATQTFNLGVLADTDVEGDETVNLQLGNITGTGAILGGQIAHTATITDDDNATVEFSNATSTTVDETAGNHAITVVLNVPSGTTPGIITVDVTDATGGSATSTADYSAVGTDTLTFPAGSVNGATQTFNLGVLADTDVEGDETVNLQVGNVTGTGAILGGQTTHTATITDDDNATVEFSNATSTTVDETAGNHAITVVLNVPSGTTPGIITVDVTDATGGSATSTADYSAVGTDTLTFPAGSVNGAIRTFNLGVLADNDVEGDETVNLQLGNITGTGAILGGQTTHTATITDDDNATVEFSNATSTTVDETAGNHAITVVLNVPSGTTPGIITVDVTDAGSGSATSGTDYNAVGTTTLTFPAGSADGATQTFNLAVLGDNVMEGNETVDLNLGNAVGTGAALGGQTSHTATITDDDTAGVIVSAISGNTDESGGAANFTVVLTSEPTADVTIPINSQDPTEGTAAPATLTFNTGNWSTPQPVTVTGVDDIMTDGDTTYTVTVGDPSSADPFYDALNDGDTADVSVINTDDDIAGVSVSAISGPVDETGGTATFTVVLTNMPTADVTIPIISLDPGEGTAAPVSLTFNSGNWSTPQPVTVTGVNDTVADGDITFTVEVGDPSSANTAYDVLTNTDTADVTVTNTDDEVAGVNVSAISGNTTEAGGTATFTVVLTVEPTADVTIPIVSLTPAEGTAAPASLVFTNGNWNIARTVTVTGVDDSVDDGNVAYTIQVGDPSSANASYDALTDGDTADVAVTNIDDDTAGVAVSAISGDTDETGATATFTVVLDSQPTANVTIPVVSLNPAEGTAAPASLTFTNGNWNTAQTVTVTGVDDAVNDGDATFTVEVGDPSSLDPLYDALNNGDTADVIVINIDDDVQADLAVSNGVSNALPVEGDSIDYTITVANNGPGTAHNIELTDVMPAGLTFASATESQGAYAAGVWNIGSVFSGSNATLTLTCTVDNGTAGTPIDNTAAITAVDQVDPVAANNSSTASIVVQVLLSVDPTRSSVTVDPQVNVADGASTSTITIVLTDSAGTPIPGKTVSIVSDRGATDTISNLSPITDANGTVTATISSATPGASTITVTDVTDGIVLSQQVMVYFSQGIVLRVDKVASKSEIVVGAVVAYQVEIRNTTTNDITPARIDDLIPTGFKYLKGSVRLNSALTADPAGSRRLRFDLGTVPALVDTDGNGQADPGEAGYMVLNYQLIAGSSVRPDTTYTNTAFGTDVCDNCLISNSAEADIRVAFDPTFDLGTIIGKVYADKNRNGWQDKGEEGVAGVMVVLDNGIYVLTDEYGRYHIPAIEPGHRMLKINLRSLADGAEATTGETVVVQVTPGLLAKANFGVIYEPDILQIGKPPEHGVVLESKAEYEPIQVVGNADNLTVLINGELAAIPTENVNLLVESLDEVIEFNGNNPNKPIQFGIENDFDDKVSSWRMKIMDARGKSIRTLSGKGAPPKTISWNGKTGKGARVKGGQIYQYQLEVRHKDGTRATSPRKLFGINQTTAISINLTGAAFLTGSAKLSEKAQTVLKETAKVLRKYPDEKIIIEGHTDDVGSAETNLQLSKLRAEAALNYLVRNEKIPEERFAVRWFGESRPITSNATPETRALNRRIEIKGTMDKVERSKLYDQYRMDPNARVNGEAMKLDSNGRFTHELTDPKLKKFRVQMVNPRGQSFDTTFNVPTIEILEPTGSVILPVGTEGDGYKVTDNGGDQKSNLLATLVKLEVKGRTDRGNVLTVDGRRITVAPDGTFRTMLGLRRGANPYGLMARNADGNTRIVNLLVTVNDSNEQGDLIIATEPIPNLVVKVPPRGVSLTSPLLTMPGATDPGNRIEINGQSIAVDPDGTFTAMVNLKKGMNKFEVFVIDPEGRAGYIPVEVEVKDTHLFFLAFGDAQLGYNMTSGNLKSAGADSDGEFFTEGRVAFYLKGVIKGKYLVTAALDTGRDELGELFNNLDERDTERLLTNLNPDKFYPVYGDDSTIVYDTESSSKLYLALDSEDLKAMFGNFMLNLNDTELATYQRTLFGANASYTSVSRTQYGDPNTKILIFGAEGEQVHVEDELRATGGSLYYLSHRDVIEGSEQVTILVRDKNTGIILSRKIQQQNVDYTIKYQGGRILFSRPIASVVVDDLLIDQDILGGDKVFIQVDYEARVDTFEKTAYGGRVRQQIGDHVAVGGTYVKDELDADYEMMGVDAEVRIAKGTRITAEYVQSEGADAETFFSDDGGITFIDTTGSNTEKGGAYKLAAELDIGEWFDKPEHYRIGGYFRRLEPGFSSSGNNAESGTDKSGVNLSLRFTKRDTIRARYDIVKNEATVSVVESQTDIGTVQYEHQHGWWSLTLEYQNRGNKVGSGSMERDSYAAARFSADVTKNLNLNATHQQTITGVENNQTTLGLQYQVLESLGFAAEATTGTIGHSAQGGLRWKVGEDKTLYLTQRLMEDTTGQTLATILGSEALVGKDAKVYSEYQWERKNEERRSISLVGAERNWEAVKGLKLLVSGEYSNIDATSGDLRRTTLVGGLSYANAAGLNFTTRQEIRFDDGTDEKVQFLTNNLLKYKFKQDFTFFGKIRYSRTDNRDLDETEAMFNEYSFGIAYRPVAFDRFNALAKYTRLGQMGPDDAGTMASFETDSDVASVEWSLDITRRVEWVEKLAYRMTTEAFGSLPEQTTHTLLNINRLNINVWRKINLGLEYRFRHQQEADDLRQGFLTEVMYEPVNHFRIGVGYNFTDFSDNEFSDDNYSAHGIFTRFQATW